MWQSAGLTKASHDGSTRTVITPQLVAEVRAIRPEELPRSLARRSRHYRDEGNPHRAGTSLCLGGRVLEGYRAAPCGLAHSKPVTLLFSIAGRKFVHRHTESLATAILILALTAGLGVLAARRVWKQKNAIEPPPSALHVRIRPSVAVLGFKNLSSRPDTVWISTALSEMLTAELAAGEQLRTVPEETVARTKIDLGLSDVESLPPDTLTQVRKNLASDFIILGSYLDLGKEKGGQVRLDLRLEDTVKRRDCRCRLGNGH